MNRDDDLFYTRAFGGLVVFHFLVWFSLGMALDLHPDEADHWVWSQYLSWGYYEHPPMIAWAIRFFTLFLGNTQWAMEFGSQAVTFLSFLGLFLLARQTFGARTAFFSIVCLAATPLFTVGSMIFIIDTMLILFFVWAAALFWKGFDRGDNKAYYWAGIALGLALLSKVTALLFPLAGLLFLLFSRERRKILKKPQLYWSLGLSLVVFSPFIYWNMTQGWISIHSQLEKGLTGGKDWNQVLGFWFGQPLILGPVLFFFFIKALWSGLKKYSEDHRLAYLVTLTLVPLVVFGLASFRGKYSDPTWTNIGWSFGAILVGKYFSDRISKVSLKKAIWVGWLIFSTSWLPIGFLVLQSLRPVIPLDPKRDRTLELVGWRQLGEGVEKGLEKIFPGQKKVYILADEYQWAGAVSFYAQRHPIPYSFSKSKRNFWINLEELKQKGAILITAPDRTGPDQDRSRVLFKKIEPLSEIPIYRQGKVVKRFLLYSCSN